jgi:hypothetical protein
MSITRYGITDGTNGRPIISGMVVRGDTARQGLELFARESTAR